MSLEINKIKKDEVLKLKYLFENTPGLAEYDPFIKGSAEEFEWQFFSENYKSSTYIVATDSENDELLGTLSALIIPMRSPDGNVCQTIKPEDTLVNIKGLVRYKNRDILQEMFDKIVSENKSMDIMFFWGFTYAVNSFNRLGFTHDFSSQQGVYVINPNLAYTHLASLNPSNGFRQKIQILGLSMFSYFKTLFKNKRASSINIKEISLKEVNEELLISFLPENLYCLYLDKCFLSYRIGKNPSESEYSILQFGTRQQPVISYLIYSRKKNSIYFIEQFLFDNKLNRKEKKEIIYAALRYFKGKKAVIVRAMGFNHNNVNKEERSLLSNVGFVFINRGIPFVFKSNHKSIKPESVYLSHLNTEGAF